MSLIIVIRYVLKPPWMLDARDELPLRPARKLVVNILSAMKPKTGIACFDRFNVRFRCFCGPNVFSSSCSSLQHLASNINKTMLATQEPVVIKVWIKGMPADKAKRVTKTLKNNGKLIFDET